MWRLPSGDAASSVQLIPQPGWCLQLRAIFWRALLWRIIIRHFLVGYWAFRQAH